MTRKCIQFVLQKLKIICLRGNTLFLFFFNFCSWIYNDRKKLPTCGDLVGVTPHPSDPAQAFPHISYPHWGILMWEGPLPNNIIWKWKAWVYLGWCNYMNGSITYCIYNNHGSNPLHIYI